MPRLLDFRLSSHFLYLSILFLLALALFIYLNAYFISSSFPLPNMMSLPRFWNIFVPIDLMESLLKSSYILHFNKKCSSSSTSSHANQHFLTSLSKPSCLPVSILRSLVPDQILAKIVILYPKYDFLILDHFA